MQLRPSTSFLPGPGIPGLVSVIIPTWNRADIIGETIASVLAQTYRDLEVVIVDDGSVDATREVVASYPDARIQYVHQENGGLSSARNAALDRVRGEFIAFLDSDDIWHPWKLAAQVELFRRHPEVGMSWTDMSTFARDQQVIVERYLRSYYGAYSDVNIEQVCTRAGTLADISTDAPAELSGCPYYTGNIFREMLAGNLVHPPTAVMRRERLRLAGGFQPEVTLGGADDYHFFLRVTEQGPVGFIDAPAILYRVHDGSITRMNTIEEARGDLRVLMHWLPKVWPPMSESFTRARLAGAHGWIGASELYAGNHRSATPHLWQSLRLKLSQPFIAALLLVSLLPSGAVPRIRAAKHAVLRMAKPATVLRLATATLPGSYTIYRLYAILQPELAE